MKQRYTALDLNHKQVDLCSKLRNMMNKPSTVRNRQKVNRLQKQLGVS
jgi:hypothetical protein